MNKNTRGIRLYLVILALSAVALGLSDGVFANYFKDAYGIGALERGLIEFPRELPGVLCIVLVSVLGFLGDIRLAIIAQILSAIGITILGLCTPEFSVMLLFLFINSLGMHLFFPLQDSIAMSIIGDEAIGKQMGTFKGVSTAFTMIASVFVFIGFRTGFFSFKTTVKPIFIISGILFVMLAGLLAMMYQLGKESPKKDKKLKLIFRKEYKYYYILAIMNGVQKQIMVVFGPWVLIDLLGQQADTLAIISIIGSFLGIFFIPTLGKWIDHYGVRKMLFLDALSFIGVYAVYGLISGGLTSGILPKAGLSVGLIMAVLIIDKMSMQMGIIRTVYLRSVAFSKEEMTQTLSLGISMDHIVSIICASIGGLIWDRMGAQYIFFFAAALSLVNLYVAFRVEPKQQDVFIGLEK